MLTIQIILFDGFDEMDALAPFEVLKTAIALGADLKAELVTLTDRTEVVAAHGLRLKADAVLDRDHPPDILMVPGGGWNNHGEQGARAEAQKGDIPAAIAQLHRQGTKIAGVCTGGMVVASAGLLKGRPAITHHGAIADLQASGADVINARVVDDGDVLTAGGVTSGLDLALWLIEKYVGPQIAIAVEAEMEYERRGTVWRSADFVRKLDR